MRQYRARPFFASAAPAPLPRSLFDQHEPSVLAHPPRSPLSGTSSIDQPARCSRSMIAMASPRSSAGERFARGMTLLSPPQLCHRSVPPLLFQVVSLKSQDELTPRTVDRLNNRHGEGRRRGPVGCGSSLTGCGRHAGPRLPCPPHGEHASIGARQYRARPFFASASPAPLPHRVDSVDQPAPSQHDPAPASHRSPLSGTSPIDQPAGAAAR